MSRPNIRIHNVDSGEVIDREMNDDEFDIWQSRQDEDIRRQKELQKKLAARQAILDRLGLSEEEARLLLG